MRGSSATTTWNSRRRPQWKTWLVVWPAPLGINWRRHRMSFLFTQTSDDNHNSIHGASSNTQHWAQLHRRSTASASSRSSYCRQYYCRLDIITPNSTALLQADPYCITLSCRIKAAHMTSRLQPRARDPSRPYR